MLIEFKAKNFTSFKNEVTFSMVSSEKLKELLNNRIEIEADFHLLKSASIFGANASGKSNLLHALGFIIAFLKRSMLDSQEGKRNFKNLTFSLDSSSKDSPTEFEISFLLRKKIITYNFSLFQGDVTSESLVIDDDLIFKRNSDEIVDYSSDFFKTEEELNSIKSFNDEISLQDVMDIYLPLTNLIQIYKRAKEDLAFSKGIFFTNPLYSMFSGNPSLIYFSASASNSSFESCAFARILANGSSPFAFAIVAFVFFFSLKGL